MKYKIVKNGYLVGVGENIAGEPISDSEYDAAMKVIRNRPTAPNGYAYRLTAGLEWELHELPIENDDPELTEAEALEIILGGDTE